MTTPIQNQDFAVIYKSNTYYVDPIKLSNSSRKFHDLIQPYLNQKNELRKLTLKIISEQFSDRNVENFLKLCQNIPTDCKDSEIPEICEIAQMFKADQIYSTGANFIRSSYNPNFNVPANKFDDQTFLALSQVLKKPHHFSDINSLEFEDDEEVQPNTNANTNQENLNPNMVADIEKYVKEPVIHSSIYRVRITQSLMKRQIYEFIVNGKVVFTAKNKDNLIVIGKGTEVHLKKDKSNHVGRIIMESGGINYVSCDNQQFRIKYIYLNGPETFSIDTQFLNRGSLLHWKPKLPQYNNSTNSYTLSLHGEFHHDPMKSVKNTVLINDKGQTSFIVRKMANQDFEVECHPYISQVVVFALALSQLIGPDPKYSGIVTN